MSLTNDPQSRADRLCRYWRRAVASCGTAVALAALASGCGNSSGPQVAHVGTTSAQQVAQTKSHCSLPSASSLASGPGRAITLGKGGSAAGASPCYLPAEVKYSGCMRSHGVPDFPDPESNGTIQFPQSVNFESPAVRSADKRCGHLLVKFGYGAIAFGSGLTPAAEAAAKAHALAFAQCMRAHGATNFPDPNSQGEISFAGTNLHIDPSSPGWGAPLHACQRLDTGFAFVN